MPFDNLSISFLFHSHYYGHGNAEGFNLKVV